METSKRNNKLKLLRAKQFLDKKMDEYTEQTEIARKLSISNTAFKRIVYHGKLEFKLINNKRHYRFSDVLRVIRQAQEKNT